MGGFSIFCLIILMTPIALGLQLGIFISRHIVVVSIIFWLLQFLFAWFIASEEKDPVERTASIMAPAIIFPSFIYLVAQALPQMECL